ncbi:hypothetical protein [Nostoc sp.]
MQRKRFIDFEWMVYLRRVVLVQEGKSKKAKVKRKNAYFVSILAI